MLSLTYVMLSLPKHLAWCTNLNYQKLVHYARCFGKLSMAIPLIY
jgi:hypothetical protein